MADAYVRLSDVIVPSVYSRYSFEEHVEKLDVFNAGLLYTDPSLSGELDNGGRTVDIPGWKDLGNDPSEPVNDDPSDSIELKKFGTRRETAARQFRAQAWGIPDLTKILAGDDPMKVLVSRQTPYWQRAMKASLIKTLQGIIADNVANDSGDLVVDTDASIADEDIIDAAFKMGDRADDFAGIWMHSAQMKVLKKADLIDYVPASEQGGMIIPTYLGLRVLVDDGIPVSTNEYTAFLFKRNAVLFEEMPVNTEGGPVEIDRKPRQAHGGGVTELVSRRQFIMHPRGFRWLDASTAGEFPTDAELALAANWDRTATSVKNTGIVALLTTES